MTLRELENRISSLETPVADLRSLLKERPHDGQDWRRAVEKYAGDEGLLEIFAEATKLPEGKPEAHPTHIQDAWLRKVIVLDSDHVSMLLDPRQNARESLDLPPRNCSESHH